MLPEPYYQTGLGKLYFGDALETLKQLPDEIIQCVVTSPPYWGLRDYGVEEQLGLEKTPEEYIDKMMEIFREIKRVLRSDGTLWLNMGDCYAGNMSRGSNGGRAGFGTPREGVFERIPEGLKPKDLCGMPWRLAFALQADDWYLRSDIIWSKPNPMPESVTDRPTKAHEYVFLMSKQARYFYDSDAVREAHKEPWRGHGENEKGGKSKNGLVNYNALSLGIRQYNQNGRNKRTVWTIPTQSFPKAHFATFPEKLVEPCIKAGTSEKGNCPVCGKPWVRVVETSYEMAGGRGNEKNLSAQAKKGMQAPGPQGFKYGRANKHNTTIGWQPSCDCGADPIPPVVLDPFMGSGTVAKVCEKYGRGWIGIELSEKYCEIASQRIEKEAAQLKLGLS